MLRCRLLDLVYAWEELETAQIVCGEGLLHERIARAILNQTPEAARTLLKRSADRVRNTSSSGGP